MLTNVFTGKKINKIQYFLAAIISDETPESETTEHKSEAEESSSSAKEEKSPKDEKDDHEEAKRKSSKSPNDEDDPSSGDPNAGKSSGTGSGESTKSKPIEGMKLISLKNNNSKALYKHGHSFFN